MLSTQAALVGCDHPHTGAHLDTLLSLPEVTGIHLWDPDPACAERLRQAAGAKFVAIHNRLDDLLADDRVGWVVAALRHDVSAEVLRRCAQAGKPVLSEKPIGLDSSEVQGVVDEFRQRGLALSVMLVNRYKPAVQALRRWVREGHLGRLCSAETRLHTTTVTLRDPSMWLFQRALSGGGILPWLGCHHLDLFHYIMDTTAVEVAAMCDTVGGEDVDVEDLAVLSLRFANGCLGSATFGYVMPGGGTGNNFAAKDTYFGLKGTLGGASFVPTDDQQVVELVSLHDAHVGAAEQRLLFREDPAAAYGQRPGLEFFRDCLRAALTGSPNPCAGEAMVQLWKVIEGAYRSQAEGVRVRL